jgi:hypothetical protein
VHFIPDEDKPAELIATLVDALPSGSYLVASHITMEHNPAGLAAGQRAYRDAGVSAQARDSSQFAELAFAGLELVPPGVVLVWEWRPDDDGPRPTPAEVSFYGGAATSQESETSTFLTHARISAAERRLSEDPDRTGTSLDA